MAKPRVHLLVFIVVHWPFHDIALYHIHGSIYYSTPNYLLLPKIFSYFSNSLPLIYNRMGFRKYIFCLKKKIKNEIRIIVYLNLKNVILLCVIFLSRAHYSAILCILFFVTSFAILFFSFLPPYHTFKHTKKKRAPINLYPSFNLEILKKSSCFVSYHSVFYNRVCDWER